MEAVAGSNFLSRKSSAARRETKHFFRILYPDNDQRNVVQSQYRFSIAPVCVPLFDWPTTVYQMPF